MTSLCERDPYPHKKWMWKKKILDQEDAEPGCSAAAAEEEEDETDPADEAAEVSRGRKIEAWEQLQRRDEEQAMRQWLDAVGHPAEESLLADAQDGLLEGQNIIVGQPSQEASSPAESDFQCLAHRVPCHPLTVTMFLFGNRLFSGGGGVERIRSDIWRCSISKCFRERPN